MAVERIEGVERAAFSYPEASGSVTYDTTLTSPAAFIAELRKATGFEARVQEGARGAKPSHKE